MKLVQVVGFGVLSQIDKSHLTMLLVRLYWTHGIWKEAKEGGKGISIERSRKHFLGLCFSKTPGQISR